MDFTRTTDTTLDVMSESPKITRDHDDHIAGKGTNSLGHYNLVHKFIHMPQAMRIPDEKAAVEK